MNIGNFKIEDRVLIIAEIGSNHNGDFNTALRLIREAHKAGADAVKFQTYRAEKLIHKSEPALKLVKRRFKTQFERFKSLEFTYKQYKKLHAFTVSRGLLFVSTPFDEESVYMLEPFVWAYKIASGDIDNVPLLLAISKKAKPILLSTGMSTVDEIKTALQRLSKNIVILMHCISNYPCPDSEINLNSIAFLKKKFPKIPVGLSDHTVGITAPLGAVALGACTIEKHFTLDNTQPIGDHCLSLEPAEFKDMVNHIRRIEKMLGDFKKEPSNAELDMRKRLRRGLAASRDIRKGVNINSDMIIPLRPLRGIPVSQYEYIIGKKTMRNIKKGEFISYCDIAF
ncbi:MAG: N-acetylneuraminate synthase [Candidatus Omnitrophica bacterium]|nr:N-acetylneuraminate synthase [Candidatus Omnitrophota bacterium]